MMKTIDQVLEEFLQDQKSQGIPFYEARGFTFKYEKQSYRNEEGEDFISLRYYRSI